MAFDYRKLKGRIVELCGSQSNFAEKMGWSERTVSLKMNSKVHWRQDEIVKAIDILNINKSEIQEYFFSIKVQ